MIHVSSQHWYRTDVRSFEWQVFNVFDSLVRWAVPIFVMISGALFLDRDISIKKLYKKYIARIITAFAFWSILYAGVSLLQGASIENACLEAIQGHYHLWFLFMIAGLYLIVPLVKKLTESQMLTKYFLILGLVFTFLIPQGISLLSLFQKTIGDAFNKSVANIHFHFALGYVVYFVLGYYLSKVDLSKKTRCTIYLLSLLSFAATIFGTFFLSLRENKPSVLMYGYYTVNVMLESLGIFVFVKHRVGAMHLGEKVQMVLAKLSKYSFGAYLVHVLVLEQMKSLLGFHTLSFHPILTVPAISLIVFAISFAVSWALHQIPLLKKYIV